jgi:hypothetical protein
LSTSITERLMPLKHRNFLSACTHQAMSPTPMNGAR